MELTLFRRLAIGVLLACIQWGAARGETSSELNSVKSTEFACGRNSLFMFLILSGHPELELAALDTLPQLPRGTSLAALREAAKHFNVDTEIRRYPTEQIASVPLPAIGHFKAGPNAYHFSVIHKVDSRNVYLIDGTTAKQLSIRRSRFGNTWTGIAMSRKETLVLARGRARWVVALLACMFVADLAIYRSFVCRLERRRADAQKASSERKPDGGPTGIKSAIDISHQPLL